MLFFYHFLWLYYTIYSSIVKQFFILILYFYYHQFFRYFQRINNAISYNISGKFIIGLCKRKETAALKIKVAVLNCLVFLLPSCGRLQNIYLIFDPIGVPLTAQYAVWRNRSHRDHVSQQQWFSPVGSAL